MFDIKEREFLSKLGFFNPDCSSIEEMEDAIGDHLIKHCLDENNDPNEEGVLCYSILDKIVENCG